MRFHAKILLTGKTATGIVVPPSVVEGLGSSRRPAVRVTIKDYTYPSTIATMGGKFMIPVSAEVREKARVAAGEQVDIQVELDNAPREVTVPHDLEDALNRDAKARRLFDGLSYSNKRRFVMPIEQAKTAETRQRRIAKTVVTLREGRI